MNRSFKISAIALAAAFASQAFAADAGVTLYGVADAGIRMVTNQATPAATALVPASGTATSMVSGGLATSRIGFKGAEDLGGGLQALFQLEGAINMTSGAGDTTLFNRISHVGLSTGAHTVFLGREYSEAYYSLAQVDPIGLRLTPFNPNVAVGALNDTTTWGSQTAGQTDIRTNNAVRYSGDFGSFKAGAQYSMGGVAGNGDASSSYGLRGSYDFGTVLVSGSAARLNNAAVDSLSNYTLGAKYTVSPTISLAGTYAASTVSGGATDGYKRSVASIGGMYTPDNMMYGVSYYNTKADNIGGVVGVSGSQDKLLGMVGYGLSKRTNLYGALDYTANHDALVSTTSGQSTAVGITAGINHTF